MCISDIRPSFISLTLKCPSEKGNELKGGYWIYDVVTKWIIWIIAVCKYFYCSIIVCIWNWNYFFYNNVIDCVAMDVYTAKNILLTSLFGQMLTI